MAPTFGPRIPWYPSHSDEWDGIDLEARPEATVVKATVNFIIQVPTDLKGATLLAWSEDAISEAMRSFALDWGYVESPRPVTIRVPHMEGDF